MRIFYSLSTDNLGPRRFQNPRFFTAPVEGATAVEIDGDYPEIAAAYKAAGVPVTITGQAPTRATPAKKAAKTRKPSTRKPKGKAPVPVPAPTVVEKAEGEPAGE